MARHSRSGPVEVEPMPPALAEEWFDGEDVRALLDAGHTGRALIDHLEMVAGERYRHALREQPHTPARVARGDVLAERPEPVDPAEEVMAWRSWIFTGRAAFRDPEGFLAEAAALA